MLCAAYWYRRLYVLYKSLEVVREKIAFLEFSFQFASPWYSSQIRRTTFRNDISPEQKSQVEATRRGVRPALLAYRIGFLLAVAIALLAGHFLSRA